MQAVLRKSLRNGVKIITGAILQDGIGVITLVVTDKNGSQSIKRFNKEDYTVRYCK